MVGNIKCAFCSFQLLGYLSAFKCKLGTDHKLLNPANPAQCYQGDLVKRKVVRAIPRRSALAGLLTAFSTIKNVSFADTSLEECQNEGKKMLERHPQRWKQSWDDYQLKIERIVEEARRTLRSRAWAPSTSWTSPGKEVFFCNEYVGYVLRQAGVATWQPIERKGLVRAYPDPLADEWASAHVKIDGWEVVYPHSSAIKLTGEAVLKLRRPGDIIAFPGKLNGHVGILGDADWPNQCVFSASSKTKMVECNRWSMTRPAHIYSAEVYEQKLLAYARQFTVRRLQPPIWSNPFYVC
jgi:hypothetical protein